MGRIWLYAGTSGVSGGTRVAFMWRSENPTSADNQQGRLAGMREPSTTTRQTLLFGREDIV